MYTLFFASGIVLSFLSASTINPCDELEKIEVSTAGLSSKELLEKERAWCLEYLERCPPSFHLHGDSPYRKALKELGYNTWPDVADMLRTETNPSLREEFARIFDFKFYRYTYGKNAKGLTYLEDVSDDPLPFLSIEVDANTGGEIDRSIDQVSMLLEWWDRRETFLKRDGACEKLREITGRTPEDFAVFNRVRSRWLKKCFSAYGIYNLPYYLELIAEDNNPILFWEFLYGHRVEMYRALNPKPPLENLIGVVQAAYPTREDKMKVICEWWEENANKFTRLEDLHEAIDNVLKQHCTEEDN